MERRPVSISFSFHSFMLLRLTLRLRLSELLEIFVVGDDFLVRLLLLDGLELFARFLFDFFVDGCNSGETNRFLRIISYGSFSEFKIDGLCFMLYDDGSLTVPALPLAACKIGAVECSRIVPPIGAKG